MVELSLTWEQVDEMNLIQVQALGRHFAKLPPLRISVMTIASALGVKFPEPEKLNGGKIKPPEFVELPEFE